jgi:hypothetical protein
MGMIKVIRIFDLQVYSPVNYLNLIDQTPSNQSKNYTFYLIPAGLSAYPGFGVINVEGTASPALVNGQA